MHYILVISIAYTFRLGDVIFGIACVGFKQFLTLFAKTAALGDQQPEQEWS